MKKMTQPRLVGFKGNKQNTPPQILRTNTPGVSNNNQGLYRENPSFWEGSLDSSQAIPSSSLIQPKNLPWLSRLHPHGSVRRKSHSVLKIQATLMTAQGRVSGAGSGPLVRVRVRVRVRLQGRRWNAFALLSGADIIEAWRRAGPPRAVADSIATYGGVWADYCRHPLSWLGNQDSNLD